MRLAILFVLLCVLALLAPSAARPPKRKDRHRPGRGHGHGHGRDREEGGPGKDSDEISNEDSEDDDHMDEDDGRMEWEMDGDEDEEEGGRPGRGRGRGKGRGRGRGRGRGHPGRGGEDMPEEDIPEEEDEEEDQEEELEPAEPGDFGNVHEDLTLEKYYVGLPLGLEQVDEERRNVPNITMAVKYLDQFGWYKGDEAEMATVRKADDMTTTMTEAVCKFQKFAGLDVTCTIDEPTLDMMNMPRCGVRDVRVANFVLGNRWDHTDLTYTFKNFSPDLTEEEQRDAIAKALNLWAEVTPLTFTPVTPDDNADIVIQFLSGDHGDGSPFDGNGGTLGHAFFPGPGIGGDTHFDEAEIFNVVTPGEFTTAVDMMTVAAHEFGHALGLGHSNIQDALMAPFYRFSSDLQLHVDDITGIQELYGAPSTVAPTPGDMTTEAATTEAEDATTQGQDVTTQGEDVTTQEQDVTTQGEQLTTAFVEDTTLVDTTTASTPRRPEPTTTPATTQAPTTTAPEPTTTAAPEPTPTTNAPAEPTTTNAAEPTTTTVPEPTTTVPETTTTTTAEPTTTQPATTTPGPDDADTCSGAPIDTITTLKNETTFVFRGKYFWRLNSRGADPGYPQLIADAWDGLPDDIDAALSWPTGKTYFFKGDQYWRFENAKMDDGYPKDISNWGLPADIDAAMYYKRGWGAPFGRGRSAVTYFFKGDEYVRYATRTGVDQGYPKDISRWGRKFPDRLDAAIRYSNGRNYVFEGDNYYRLTRSGRVYFGYPRSVAKWWMGCD